MLFYNREKIKNRFILKIERSLKKIWDEISNVIQWIKMIKQSEDDNKKRNEMSFYLLQFVKLCEWI